MDLRISPIVAALALTVAACQSGGGTAQVDNSQDRKDRVLENLKAKYPRLGDLNPSLGDFKEVSSGLDEVTMSIATPQGEQKQQIIVTKDHKAYLVMEGPIDVSKNAGELKAEAAKKEGERRTELTKAAEGYPVRGNPNAKVTIIEFSDFQCPFCKRGADTMEQVLEKYPNDVKLVFMHYPLPFHPWAKPASIAAICAGNQDPQAFWKLHDAYFDNQGEVTPENVLDKSKQFLGDVKLDMSKWQKCAGDQSTPEHQAAAKQVEDALALGQKFGVEGTPAFFVNGKFVSGALPFENFEKLVQEALAEKT